ncbi:MAG: prephenate dehydratase [Candidatus Bathyarchaeia archaeon]
MSTPIVSFQGEHGAYSEQAATMFFGQSVGTKPCKTLKQVFQLVEEKSVDYGIVPAENSLEGSVNQTYDLLLETSLGISGEVKVRVIHCLLAIPGTKIEDLRIVYSHPQALAQCAGFLEKLDVEAIPAYDTAGSAKMLTEKQFSKAGAIASERSAELYGLEVLRKNIEDFPENFTRFFVLAQTDALPTGKDRTSIVFATAHTPGSLHNALSQLSSRQINLTKIESRPIRGMPWKYNFFVDFEGHQRDPMVSEAINALRNSTTMLRVLGSYPRAD